MTLRRMLAIALVLGTLACEGATLRCDPTLSWSVRRDELRPDGGDDLCRGECDARDLALGERHTCAIVGALEEVVCFGANEAGQSSPRSAAPEILPTAVHQRARSDAALDFGRVLATGALHSCALYDGRLACWGSPAVIGGDRSLPRTLDVEGGIHLESGSAHVGVLVYDGVRGFSEWTFLGRWDGVDPLADAPLDRARPATTFTAVALAGFFTWETLVVSDRFALHGGIPEPGLFPTSLRRGPIFLDPPEDAGSYSLCGHCNVGAGPFHLCSRRAGPGVACAGVNERGQLGRETLRAAFDDRFADVAGLEDLVISQICAGGSLSLREEGGEIAIGARRGGHTCAIDAAGDTWCWGANDRGQLGDGTTEDRFLPRRVDVPRLGVVRCGGEHTCGVDAEGTIWCWGDNGAGQLGVPSSELAMRALPAPVSLASALAGP